MAKSNKRVKPLPPQASATARAKRAWARAKGVSKKHADDIWQEDAHPADNVRRWIVFLRS